MTAITYLANLLLGASLTLAYAPFSYWFITPIIFTLFLVLLHQSKLSPFKSSWFFSLGWFGAGISWVHVSIANFGGLPLVVSLLLMLLLCGYLALYPALSFHFLKSKVPFKHWYWALPALWFVTEWLRGWVLTGFPWLSLGYSQINSVLANWAPVIGETGISMLVVGICALLGRQFYEKRLLSAFVSLSLIYGISSLIGHISWTTQGQKSFDIAMVQGNIKQELRWAPEQDGPTMHKYMKMTESAWDADIIIWPEAAIPRLEALSQLFLNQLDEKASATSTGLITGIVNYNFETNEAYNNLISLGVTSNNQENSQEEETGYYYGHPNRFAKHHLLPIGEFIPMEDWLRGLAPIFDLPMSSFSRGDYRQPNLLTNNAHMVPAICFEIAFPQQIRANIHADSDFIITVSNDAWFGDSHGPHQHLEIAQMRAREMGLPVLRATNNGVTAFINEQGDILAQAPQFEEAVLRHTIHNTSGVTPYRYLGDLPHWIWVVISVLIYLRVKRKTMYLYRDI